MSLMIWLLRELGAKFDYYIPHRVHEGYGWTSLLQKAKDDGVDLIITVDTGISAVDEAAYAAELGLQIDYYRSSSTAEVLPSAVAVINPKKPGCMYPFKQLAGVGVAFKLAEALLERVPERLAELAALGTIADLMPLIEKTARLCQLAWHVCSKRPSSACRSCSKFLACTTRRSTPAISALQSRPASMLAAA